MREERANSECCRRVQDAEVSDASTHAVKNPQQRERPTMTQRQAPRLQRAQGVHAPENRSHHLRVGTDFL